MKRIILATALLLAGCFASKAQETAVGLGYCMTSEFFTGLPTEHYNGAFISATRDVEISDIFNFQPGLVITAAFGGVSHEVFNYYGIEGHEDGQLKNWTLSIPLLFKAGTDFSGRVRGFIQAGPEINFGLTSRCTRGDTVINYYGNGQMVYRRWNISVKGGLSIDISERHRICANYSYGLLNQTKIQGCKDKMSCLTVGYYLLMF